MARKLICVRLSEAGLAAVDGYAAASGLTRSDAIRTLLPAGLLALGVDSAALRAEGNT